MASSSHLRDGSRDGNEADAVDLLRLLRVDGERRGEESRGENDGEDDCERSAHAPAASLCAEELDEARLDLFVALLQLFRLDPEQLQVRELGPVGRIFHGGMAGVEPLAVGEDLLELAAEDEVGEELGRVRMRGEAG